MILFFGLIIDHFVLFLILKLFGVEYLVLVGDVRRIGRILLVRIRKWCEDELRSMKYQIRRIPFELNLLRRVRVRFSTGNSRPFHRDGSDNRH